MGKFKMKLEKHIGKRTYEFYVEGENLHEAVLESRKLSFHDVHKCGICQGVDLELDAWITKESNFSYTAVQCNSCKAKLNFGQQLKDKNIFYLKTVPRPEGGGNQLDWIKS
jgi:hypothetical protein